MFDVFDITKLPAYIQDKVMPEPMSGCWIWTAFCNPGGYGMVRFHGRSRLAHRAVFILTKGEIPLNKQLDHLCRNRQCVNPNHLEAVSAHENLRRGKTWEFHRSKIHCANGHDFSPENTGFYKGLRYCRQCKKHRAKLWRQKVKRASY